MLHFILWLCFPMLHSVSDSFIKIGCNEATSGLMLCLLRQIVLLFRHSAKMKMTGIILQRGFCDCLPIDVMKAVIISTHKGFYGSFFTFCCELLFSSTEDIWRVSKSNTPSRFGAADTRVLADPSCPAPRWAPPLRRRWRHCWWLMTISPSPCINHHQ